MHCVLDTILGAKDAAVNMTGKVPALTARSFSREHRNKEKQATNMRREAK